jgi:hypothetical protein
VADDASSSTRYVLVQGSVTVEHWRINLQIDPVPFEDPFLGIKVHRGMYQAALNLYDQLLPSVQEYVAANPDGRICFSGHSLGGSLATLLMALYVHRGVLQQHNVAPVHTFGAPAVFCHGAGSYTQEDSCTSCSLSCQMAGRNDTVPHPQVGPCLLCYCCATCCDASCAPCAIGQLALACGSHRLPFATAYIIAPPPSGPALQYNLHCILPGSASTI